jgi:flagella basal body P-ring formation protein FlgA
VFNINDLIIINTDKNNINDINYLVDTNYSTFLIAKKTLKQYQPIRIKDIKKQALILKGQVITAILKKKNLTIEIQGIAMEDGAQSEIIKIKTKNKILNAKIINDHYVALVI